MSVDEERLKERESICGDVICCTQPGAITRIRAECELSYIAEIRRLRRILDNPGRTQFCLGCERWAREAADLKTANAALDAENADLRRRYEECRARGLAEAIRKELSGVVAERSELMGLLIKAEAENAELRKERDEHLNASLRYYAQIGDMENEAEAENVKLCKVANENADLRQRLAELTKQIQGLGGTPETCRED